MATKGKKVSYEDVKRLNAGHIVWVELFNYKGDECIFSKEGRIKQKEEKEGNILLYLQIAGEFRELIIRIIDLDVYAGTYGDVHGKIDFYHIGSFSDRALKKEDVSKNLQIFCEDLPLKIIELAQHKAKFNVNMTKSILNRAPDDVKEWKQCHYIAQAFLNHFKIHNDILATQAAIDVGKFVSEKLFLCSRDGFDVDFSDIIKSTIISGGKEED